MAEGSETRSVRRRILREFGGRLTSRAVRMAARAPGQGETPETLRALAGDRADETATCLRLAAELCEARMTDERRGRDER
ncbi:hypothetical protein Ae168Ps1_6375c [Pseudonocardia sp. Ae168_Ps1]|nr:hypothetical protein Ae150APs1_6192 [Pseudonocardia sp. Ae150A_Ps1]OLL70138.1 hypothetical protein Ae168Ps1_6375c [Pseudonocardia sp. Ae168_Ps1]OLL70409.1 hypothetical protein Ae263Ps1_6353c [Pseudonocardia sp. Ae263_Ps1]OLL89190.1 hypothetical protein Ae356Ps1_6218c [Pseudonocardia sp. Ae356_Ps1]